MSRCLMYAGVVLAAMAGPAHSEVVINNTFDYSFLAFVPCANGGNGELVLLEGPRHEQFRLNINGGQVRSGFHANMHDFTGMGLTTGDMYRATGGLNAQVKGDVFHLRVNPDGIVTSNAHHDFEKCH